MQKEISANIDESIALLVEQMAKEKKISKKTVIEEAIKYFWENNHSETDADLFENSFGAWNRDESVEDTVQKARSAFNQSMNRHHTTKD